MQHGFRRRNPASADRVWAASLMGQSLNLVTRSVPEEEAIAQLREAVRLKPGSSQLRLDLIADAVGHHEARMLLDDFDVPRSTAAIALLRQVGELDEDLVLKTRAGRPAAATDRKVSVLEQ